MQALLDYIAWYLTAILVGVSLLPVIYGFKDPIWALGPLLGIGYCVARTIQIIKGEPPGTITRWLFLWSICIVIRLIIN